MGPKATSRHDPVERALIDPVRVYLEELRRRARPPVSPPCAWP